MTGPATGTIMGVWAHPDDETYLSAGIMADAVRRGSRVACVTATRGEEGSFDEERWPTAAMGAVRQAELERSLAILGVVEHTWLDYYDGTCAGVDPAEGTARIRELMRDVNPRTVLTFGPDGMTGHDDHKSVSAWTTAAFREVAPPGARLCYATMTPEWKREWGPVFDRVNVFMEPGTPPVTSPDGMEIAYELPPDVLELKLRAIEAHESQVAGMLELFGPDVFRGSQRTEWFRLAEVRPE